MKVVINCLPDPLLLNGAQKFVPLQNLQDCFPLQSVKQIQIHLQAAVSDHLSVSLLLFFLFHCLSVHCLSPLDPSPVARCWTQDAFSQAPDVLLCLSEAVESSEKV